MTPMTETATFNCPPSHIAEHPSLDYEHNCERAESIVCCGNSLADAEVEHRERLALLVSRDMPSSLAAIYRTAIGLWDNFMPRNWDRKAVGAALMEIADVAWGRSPRVEGWSAEGVLGLAGLQHKDGFGPVGREKLGTTPSLATSAHQNPQCVCPVFWGNTDAKGVGAMGNTRKLKVAVRSGKQKQPKRLRRLEELPPDEAEYLGAIYDGRVEGIPASRVPEGLARMIRFWVAVQDGVIPRDEDLRFYAEAFRKITASRTARPLPATEPDDEVRQKLTDEERRMTPKSLTIPAMLSTARGPECDVEVALGIKRLNNPGGLADLKYVRAQVALRVHLRMRYLGQKEAIREIAKELKHEHDLERDRDPSPLRLTQGWEPFVRNCLGSLDSDAFNDARMEEWNVRSDETDAMLERTKSAQKQSRAALKARRKDGVAYAVIWETPYEPDVQFSWYQTEQRARAFADVLRKRQMWVHEIWKY